MLLKRCIIVLLFFLFICPVVVAQNYYEFPLENSQWTNRYRAYELDQWFVPNYTQTNYDNFCASGNDTVINTISYKQIDYCNTNSSTYHGSLRYNSGQVFFVPKDSLNEYLLYDFTLSELDTAEVIIMQGVNPSFYQIFDVVINQVDSIIVNGTVRRRLYTSGSEWIEGIGNIQGLFLDPWQNVSNYFLDLICMTENDTVMYESGPLEVGILGTCALDAKINENSEELNFNISPNPAKSIITISNIPSGSFEISITSVTGEVLFSSFLWNKTNTVLALDRFSNGVYFLNLETTNSKSTKRFIVSK